MEIFQNNISAILLFAFSLGAFVIPLISRKFSIPIIIGEMIFGYYLGKSLSIEVSTHDIQFIQEISNMGFIFLMFLAGMEINFDKIKLQFIKRPLLIISLFYAISFLIYTNFPSYFQNPFIFCTLLASSIGYPFIILKNFKLEKSNLGQKIILITSITEIISIIILIIYELIIEEGSNIPFYKNIDLYQHLFNLFLVFLFIYILIKIILRFFWHFPNSVYVLDTKTDNSSSEIVVRLSFFILLSMLAVTSILNLEAILGAFLSGILISFVFRNKKIFEEKMSSIGYGFFIPFFFIKLGFDFNVPVDELLIYFKEGLKYFGIIFILRFIPSIFLHFHTHNHISIKEKVQNILITSLLWSTPFTLIVAYVTLGLELKALSQKDYNALIMCATIGALFAPFIVLLLKGKKVT